MAKISMLSQYYKHFSRLSARLNSDIEFRDTSFHIKEYKNKINPITISSQIIEDIENYMSIHYFTKEITLLIIESLSPEVDKYGSENIKFIKEHIQLRIKLGAPLNNDYYKTIIALEETRQLLIEKFNSYYKKIALPSEIIGNVVEKNSGNKEELNISQIKNNFDSEDINEIYKHFKAGLVDKKYLSDKDLINYLYAAFDKMTPPKELFTLADANKKQKIIRVFGEYYRVKAKKPIGKQREYAALLGNYFKGYNTANVSTNFSK